MTEGSDYFSLQRRGEIDQKIPATDQIHAGKRRIIGDIVPGEDAQIANAARYLISGIRAHEELPETLRRDVEHRALVVDSLARQTDGSLAHVGSEHLNGAAELFRFQELR